MTNEDQQRLMQYAKAHGVSAIGSYGKGGLPTVMISQTETADFEWGKWLVDQIVAHEKMLAGRAEARRVLGP